MKRFIGWRGRKENCWKDILIAFITLGGALVAPPQLFHKTHLLLVDMPHWTTSTSFCWIAAHIYFVWSPELMRLGLVVCGVGGWISTSTCAPNPHASSRAHPHRLSFQYFLLIHSTNMSNQIQIPNSNPNPAKTQSIPSNIIQQTQNPKHKKNLKSVIQIVPTPGLPASNANSRSINGEGSGQQQHQSKKREGKLKRWGQKWGFHSVPSTKLHRAFIPTVCFDCTANYKQLQFTWKPLSRRKHVSVAFLHVPVPLRHVLAQRATQQCTLFPSTTCP